MKVRGKVLGAKVRRNSGGPIGLVVDWYVTRYGVLQLVVAYGPHQEVTLPYVCWMRAE